MEIRTPLTLTPSEYIEGIYQGRFKGDELANNSDDISKVLANYLQTENDKIEPYITLIMAIRSIW